MSAALTDAQIAAIIAAGQGYGIEEGIHRARYALAFPPAQPATPAPVGGALDAERAADEIALPMLPECYDLMAYKGDAGASTICGYSAQVTLNIMAANVVSV